MRRGDIVWVDLDPGLDSETNKIRPAVVVSNDGANRRAGDLGRGVVTVVPLTSRTEPLYPFQVLLPGKRTGLPRTSRAQAEQTRAVSVQRIGAKIGRTPRDLLAALDDAIRLHLAL